MKLDSESHCPLPAQREREKKNMAVSSKANRRRLDRLAYFVWTKAFEERESCLHRTTKQQTVEAFQLTNILA